MNKKIPFKMKDTFIFNEYKSILFLLIIVLFYCYPYIQGDRIPGENHDARITLYVLEEFFRGVVGKGNFLNGAFAPWPYTLLLSEPLWGSAPIYAVFRLIGFSNFSSYEIWFVIGNLLNAISCYYALRVLKIHCLPSILGAILFSISLPVTSQDAHSALLYRFLVPIAFMVILRDNEKTKLETLLKFLLINAVQFLFSLYMGFFLAIIALPILYFVITSNKTLIELSDYRKYLLTLIPIIIVSGIALLPSKIIQDLYSVKPNINEIKDFAPSITAFLFADRSLIWKLSELANVKSFSLVWEKQLFFGLLPTLTLLYYFFPVKRSLNIKKCLITVVFSLLIFINFLGDSVYSKIAVEMGYFLPRASGRFILVLLFPLSFIFASFCETIFEDIKGLGSKIAIIALFFFIVITENLFVFRLVSSEDNWRKLTADIINKIDYGKDNLNNETILVVGTELSGWDNNKLQIDAMLAAQYLGIHSLNGISSIFPNKWSPPNHCTAFFEDHLSYNEFAANKHLPQYKNEKNYLLVDLKDCYLNNVISGIDFHVGNKFKNVYELKSIGPQEDWGRWQIVTQDDSRLIYKFSSTQNSKLSIKVMAMPSPSPEDQIITAEIQGQSQSRKMIRGINEYNFFFDLNKKDSEEVVLSLSTNKPVRPIDVGINKDTRLLGLGIVSIIID